MLLARVLRLERGIGQRFLDLGFQPARRSAGEATTASRLRSLRRAQDLGKMGRSRSDQHRRSFHTPPPRRLDDLPRSRAQREGRSAGAASSTRHATRMSSSCATPDAFASGYGVPERSTRRAQQQGAGQGWRDNLCRTDSFTAGAFPWRAQEGCRSRCSAALQRGREDAVQLARPRIRSKLSECKCETDLARASCPRPPDLALAQRSAREIPMARTGCRICRGCLGLLGGRSRALEPDDGAL